MICYIKDGRTFRTKYHAPAEYEVTVKSIYEDSSSITIPGRDKNVAAGDLVFMGDFCGVVEEVEEQPGVLVLTCGAIEKLFQRALFHTEGTTASSVESFMKRQLEREFLQVEDLLYRLPYLEVQACTKTAADICPDVDGGLWNMKAFMAKVREEQGIFTEFDAVGSKLRVSLLRRDRPMHKIDLKLSAFEVLEESFAQSQIGRVSAYAQDTGEVSDWYRLEDGSITQKYTMAGRMQGSWEKLVVSNAEKVEEEVLAKFRESSYSHLIEFATEKQYGFCDEVQIRTEKGRVLRSYISSISKKSTDPRTFYKTGELRLMIDEKLVQLLG